jgi:asparagine N-glycosylation enzyme membrane subunit Stt3
MITLNNRLQIILLSVAFLLLIPFVAMQFTTQVNWSPFDFLMMGMLLLGAGLGIDLVLRKVKKLEYRIALCLTAIVLVLLIWVELAVGIFGTPFAGS